MSEDYKKKYEELLKQIQDTQERRGMGRDFLGDAREFGGLEGFYQQHEASRMDPQEFRKKYEEVLEKRRGDMMEYFSRNPGTTFGEQFESRFNQMVSQDDFFWRPQWEKTKSVTLSLRIDAGLKQWLENLADELGTSSSKIVERALSLLRSARTIAEADTRDSYPETKNNK